MNENELFAPLKAPWKEPEKDSISNTSSFWRRGVVFLKTNRMALLGFSLLGMITFMAFIGPSLSPYHYETTDLANKNLPPTFSHWFGTDELGRDLFTRSWWGARISLFVGLAASLIDLFIGVFYGSIAGFYGGKIDEWMMRLTDILSAIPYLLIVILFTVIIGTGIGSIIFAIALTGWINMARIVRSRMLQIKQLDFIRAAEALGASKGRIIFSHLIPNALETIAATLTLTIPAAIFAEAFLSFLGLGVQAPFASLGAMANDGLSSLRYYPWRLFFPAGLISLTILSFNLIGEALRDALDPRLQT